MLIVRIYSDEEEFCMKNRNIVVSYENPDMDGVACSIAMAGLLSDEESDEYIPAVIGKVDAETEYVLEELHIDKPGKLEETDMDALSYVLVDTHHILQLPGNFPYDKVKMIIDHHPNGDDEKFPHAYIDNRKTGAAASIVAERYFDSGNHEERMLRLLSMAIVSNTLNFSAPSTTAFDRNIYNRINDRYPVSEKLISSMFEERSKVLFLDMKGALVSNVKLVQSHVGKVGISQLEIYDLLAGINVETIRTELEALEKNNGMIYLFNGVDIKTKKTIVISAGRSGRDLLRRMFQLPFDNGYELFDRILLRKTDFFPRLM